MKTEEEILRSGIWNTQPMPYVGMCGFVKLPECGTCSVVWSRDEDGLEHVSVSPRHKYRIPSWDDMCYLKDIFFDDEEEVYQIHPPKSQYVNVMQNCLHLWKRADGRRLGGQKNDV